jgi:serine/threonine protein kinase
LSKAGKHGFLSRDRVKTIKNKNDIIQKSLEDKSFLFLEALRSVNVLSEKGITHNDLKWPNFLRSSEFGVKLTDLELAKTKKEIMVCGVKSCDNPRHKPPEILMIERAKFTLKNPGYVVGTASDVWSLGIMLCELFLGVNPFDPDEYNPNASSFDCLVEDRILSHDGTLDERLFCGLPAERVDSFKALVSSMLDPDPRMRPSVDAVIGHNFFQMCNLYNGRDLSQMNSHLSAISGGVGWTTAGRRARKVHPQRINFQPAASQRLVIGNRRGTSIGTEESSQSV